MELITRRLILRAWQEQDAEDLYRYAKDPEVGIPAGFCAHTSVQKSLEVIRSVLTRPGVYAVCLKEDRCAIGSIGLYRSDIAEKKDECELGYWLAKPYWGKGIITEAAQEIIRHAFAELKLQRVWCGYYDGNVKSRRVMDKLGFVYHHTNEGIEVKAVNEIRTGHVMLLTRKAWNKIK